jgi:hypothetical protein
MMVCTNSKIAYILPKQSIKKMTKDRGHQTVDELVNELVNELINLIIVVTRRRQG